jgi:hypothetical protein
MFWTIVGAIVTARVLVFVVEAVIVAVGISAVIK